MSFKEHAWGVICGVVGLTIVTHLFPEERKTMLDYAPKYVRTVDINHDGLSDIVIESQYRTNIFIGTSTNSYISFEQYKSNQVSNLQNSFLELEQNAAGGKK